MPRGDENETDRQKLNRHDEEIGDLSERVGALEEADRAIMGDIAKIKDALAHTPTKNDLSQVELRLTAVMTGSFKDALNSVPGQYMLIWCAVSAIIAAAALIIDHWHG